MKTIILFLAIPLCSCVARTEFYRDGKKIAMFQGDMENAHLTIDGDKVRWSASKVDHSTATKAQGEAERGRIEALNTASAAAALSSILK